MEEKDFYSQSENSKYAKKIKKFTRVKESAIKFFFAVNGTMALIFIILIFIFLFKEGFRALDHISLLDFLYFDRADASGTVQKVFEWYPTSEEPRYSLIPLLIGTFLTAFPATVISTLLGVGAGIYLSEVANPKLKEFLKPMIELFAGIPTVVLGFIMLVIGASFFNDLLNPANRLNAFVAAIGLSFVIIPIIASLTEDALHSIPNKLRMASYGLGATKWQTISKVIFMLPDSLRQT